MFAELIAGKMDFSTVTARPVSCFDIGGCPSTPIMGECIAKGNQPGGGGGICLGWGELPE